MPDNRLNLALAMAQNVFDRVFTPRHLAELAEHARVLSANPITTFDDPLAHDLLARVEVLITGWGCPPVDAAVLDHAPRLRYIIHAAGTVKHHLTPTCWERGIEVSSAAAANAVPVAEFTVAMVLLSGKRVLQLATALRQQRGAIDAEALFPTMGNYRKQIGIVGASKIGRHVIELLSPYAFTVVVADPHLDERAAAELGVTLMELDDLIATSDIVSLHAPSLPETHHMIDERRIALLRPDATIINTARGELVDQNALTRRIQRGDLHAVLDVTTPWVLDAADPLYEHPNVLLTPHIAGSLGVELERLAETAVAETRRLSRGHALAHPVLAVELPFMA